MKSSIVRQYWTRFTGVRKIDAASRSNLTIP
jgi:hypothetical protein